MSKRCNCKGVPEYNKFGLINNEEPPVELPKEDNEEPKSPSKE